MTSADKCFLNVPFKDYLKKLKVGEDGQIDQAALTLAGSQEFDNYKAIERRINDPACGGECACAAFKLRGAYFDGSQTTEISVGPTTEANDIIVFEQQQISEGGCVITGSGLGVDLATAGVYVGGIQVWLEDSSGSAAVWVRVHFGDNNGGSSFPVSMDGVVTLPWIARIAAPTSLNNVQVIVTNPGANSRVLSLYDCVWFGHMLCGCPAGVAV